MEKIGEEEGVVICEMIKMIRGHVHDFICSENVQIDSVQRRTNQQQEFLSCFRYLVKIFSLTTLKGC